MTNEKDVLAYLRGSQQGDTEDDVRKYLSSPSEDDARSYLSRIGDAVQSGVAQTVARIGQGVTDLGATFERGAAKIDKMLGRDPTRSLERAANLDARSALIEDVVPKPSPETGQVTIPEAVPLVGGAKIPTARFAADVVQQTPALLASEAAFSALAPAKLKALLETQRAAKTAGLGERAVMAASNTVKRAVRGAGEGLAFGAVTGESPIETAKEFAIANPVLGLPAEVLNVGRVIGAPAARATAQAEEAARLAAKRATEPIPLPPGTDIKPPEPKPLEIGKAKPGAAARSGVARPPVEPPPVPRRPVKDLAEFGAVPRFDPEHRVGEEVRPIDVSLPPQVETVPMAEAIQPAKAGSGAAGGAYRPQFGKPGSVEIPAQPFVDVAGTTHPGTSLGQPINTKLAGDLVSAERGVFPPEPPPIPRDPVASSPGATEVPPTGTTLQMRGGGALAGGALGYASGDTPEEKKQRAILGMGLGLGAEMLGGVAAKKAAAKELPDFSKRIEEKISGGLESDKPKRSISEWVQDIYAGFTSSTEPFRNVEKKIAGKEVAPEKSIYAAARATQGSARRAEGFLTYGPARYDTETGNWTATGTPGLEKVAEMAGGDVDALSRYQVAKRSLELNKRGIKTPFSEADAAAEIQASPQLEEAHKAAVAFDNDVMRYWADAGGMSPEALAAAESLNRDYVNYGRVFKGAAAPPGARVGGVAQQIKKIVGGETADIKDPWLSRIDRTARIVRAADRQRVALALVNLAEENPEAASGLMRRVTGEDATHFRAIAQEVKNVQEAAARNGVELSEDVAKELAASLSDKALAQDNTISLWRNGKRETWEIDDRLAKAFGGLAPQETNWLLRLIGAPVGVMRAGVTLDPSFAFANAWRDGLDAAIQSKTGVSVPGFNGFRGFYEAARAEWLGKASPLYEDYIRSGGGFSTLRGSGTKAAQAMARQLEPKGAVQSTVDVVAHPIDALKRFTQPFEEAARIGEFARSRKAGQSDIASFMRQQDVTVNFQEIGPYMRGLNMMTPFLNAGVQGLRKTAHTLADPLVAVATKPGERAAAAKEAARVYGSALAFVTIPSVYFWMASRNDQEIKDLRKQPGGQLYWFLRTPSGEVLKMPKPFLYGQLFGTSAEAVLDKMADDDPEAMERWAQHVAEGASVSLTPMLVQVPSDLRANKSSFFDQPIVPRGKEDLLPRLQYNSYTSPTFRELGEKADISPAKAQYVFEQVSGTLGRHALGLADRRAAKAERPLEKADNPLYGRFFARTSTTGKEPVTTFYDEMNRLETLYSSLRQDVKAQPERVRELYDPADIAKIQNLPEYRQRAEQIKDLRAALDGFMASNATVEAKANAQKKINQMIVELARATNGGG